MLPLLAQQALGASPDAGDEIGPGLAVDETTDLKRGASTVSPQHSGVTGKTENCVTWVFSALVTATGQCWAWSGLYMPECWAKDPARRKKAGIPRSLTFATKPELAIAQVKAVIERGIRICWVAADEVCGRSGDFRAACRDLSLSYVVIIPCDYRVTLARGTAPARAAEAARGAVFERRSAGNGTKGPRYGWQALLATEDPEEFLLTALAMIRVIFLRGFLARGTTDGEPLPVPGPAPAAGAEDTASTSTGLRIHPGADTVPAVAGLPCRHSARPPVRHRDRPDRRPDQGLHRRAPQPRPALVSFPLVTLAPPPPGPRAGPTTAPASPDEPRRPKGGDGM